MGLRVIAAEYDMEMNLQEALDEIRTKPDAQIEHETAIKWMARSIAAFLLVLEEQEPKAKVERFDQADDLRHEALEHAALAGDGGKLVGLVQGLIDAERVKAQAHLDQTVFSSYPAIAQALN